MSNRIAPADPIEAKMGAGTVVLRDKVVSRRLALISLAMFVAFTAMSISYFLGEGAHHSFMTRYLAYFFVPFSAWIGLTKTVLRTVVTTKEIHSQLGFRATHIPIAAITSCRVFEERRAPRGTEVFSPSGMRGMLVEWRDSSGVARMSMIGSDDPAALVTSVAQARNTDDGRTRIAPPTSVEPEAAAAESDEPIEEVIEGDAKRLDRR